MALSKVDAIRVALKARGERQVPDPALSKYEKWTRTYHADRLGGQQLVRVEGETTYYFVNRKSIFGTRYGTKSTGSYSVTESGIQQLVSEGLALYKADREVVKATLAELNKNDHRWVATGDGGGHWNRRW